MFLADALKILNTDWERAEAFQGHESKSLAMVVRQTSPCAAPIL